MAASATAPESATPARAKAASAPNILQLLAFVFASADVVVEIDEGGRIGFATGAASRLTGRAAEALTGLHWRELVDPADAPLVEAALKSVRPGERRGPFNIGLIGSGGARPASLSLFQMPQRPGIAAAMSLRQPSVGRFKTDSAGLISREDFEQAASSLLQQAELAGVALSVDLLELTGLKAALGSLPTGEAEAVRRKVAAVLQAASYGGAPAAALGPESFAMLRAGQANLDSLLKHIQDVAGPGVGLSSGALSLNPETPAEGLRAIRYALDRCLEEGPPAAAASFETALRKTVADTAKFKDSLKAGRFELVYQPVVDLKTRRLHHYEALTRFGGDEGPAATIRLAEELGLVAELDITVIRTVAAALREAPPEIRVAANVSAFSLMQPGFVQQVIQVSATSPSLRPRLMLELTETHRLTDLETANGHIQGLREAGHVICLDDFGAGAASLDYLRQLEADIVKFDGRFVKSLGSSPRDAVMLKRLAELCRELGVSTVAEMIETEDTAQRALGLGVVLGQGWLFGKPGPKPVPLAGPGPTAARRRGEVETWG
jgi:EAL domain-containing protein (putative c-di-GMP-specific phosphodiesterase class I)